MKVDKLPTTRLSRKTGRLDGREGLPELQAAEPHSPFLDELTAVGSQHSAQNSDDLSLNLRKLHSENSRISARRVGLIKSQQDVNVDISFVENLYAQLNEEYVGSENQSPASKITDRRFIPSWLYLLLISISIVGEVLVTYPAFEEIFGEDSWISIITTGAASAMTIGYAFILGLVLKRHDDKKRLLQRWVLPTALSCGIFIFGLIGALSNIRANNFAAPDDRDLQAPDAAGSSETPPAATELGNESGLVPGTQEEIVTVPDGSFLEGTLSYTDTLLLFVFLQLSLVAIATLGEYFHYSYFSDEQRRIKNLLNKLRKKQVRLINEISQITATIDSTAEREKHLRMQHSAIFSVIKKKVESRFQAYWGINIRQRADSPDAKSRKFLPPPLSNPDWFISE